jgi:hypothetical protein
MTFSPRLLMGYEMGYGAKAAGLRMLSMAVHHPVNHLHKPPYATTYD